MPARDARLLTPASSSDADEDGESPWPDLVLIDGGQGQLSAAQRDAGRARHHRCAAGRASPRARTATPAARPSSCPAASPFKLPPRDPLLYFVQRLRDEAHRFAIGSHRTRRKKDIREAGLQEIPGIGPTRKRALLHHFGTLKAIERASLADLAKVPGINAETARKIYDFFHETASR